MTLILSDVEKEAMLDALIYAMKYEIRNEKNLVFSDLFTKLSKRWKEW